MLAKLTNVLIIVLSLTLGFFFMFVGILKLTPAVKEDTHEEMVSVDFGVMPQLSGINSYAIRFITIPEISK